MSPAAKRKPRKRESRVRRALSAHTGVPTIPQVFIGGQFVGGCTETMDAYRAGTLQARLKLRGVAFDESAQVDPATLLPGWLQRR